MSTPTSRVDEAIAAAVDDADRPKPLRRTTVERFRLLAASLALVVLAFVQAPGRIAQDTKYDLSADPLAFLARAWHLWEPLGDSGQLQNQAYGYFLPMGPFYVVGHALGLPAWVVQRLWWSVILLTAFHGFYLLATRLGLGRHPTRLIGAFAYALSPRMMTELGPVSIEAWPIATAPWVLLPLVKVAPGRHVRAAARSALAVALTGGVNAIATGAVLPLPLWWLLTRRRSPARRELLLAWFPAVLAAIAWWLIPLVMLGRYSPPFLDWIENAGSTTSRASVSSAFRGTTQWVAWLRFPEPVWPAGWLVVASPAIALLTWLLIGIAAAALLRRGMPHRSFLVGGILGGLFLLTLGHVGAVSPAWAPAFQAFLDHAGAPMRNTHKFDLILRLPLCLALTHALAVIRVPSVRGMPWTRRGLVFTATCAVLGIASPGMAGQLPAHGSFTAVPGYWQAAADWLDANDDGGRTLILPGSTFATSIWGDPHDEPIQALARTPWAVRSAVPLSSAGNIRMLNAVEAQLATGRGSPGLADFLARAGITRLLVRADLVSDGQVGATPRAVTVRAALAGSPGLSPVQRFGPTLGGDSTDRFAFDSGLDLAVPALEVWNVDRPSGLAQVFPADSLLKVSGATESLLPLAASGALADRPTVLDGDPDATLASATGWALTDTPLRREATFSRVRDIYGPVLTADEPYQVDRAEHDWSAFPRPLVTALVDGVRAIRTSSDAGAVQGGWQAFDRDATTAWTSGQFAAGQWIEADLERPTDLPAKVPLTFGGSGVRVAAITVSTDRGSIRTELPANLLGRTARVDVPGGSTRRIRFTITSVWSGQDLGQVTVSEIVLPGVQPRRPLVVPSAGNERTAPELVSLQVVDPASDACRFVADRSWCAPGLARPAGETTLDRFVDLPAGAAYRVTATVRPRPGGAVERLLRPSGVPEVVASSRFTPEPAQRPQAVFDDDPATTWMAAGADSTPQLKLRWDGERSIGSLRWFVADGVYVSRPTSLQVTVGRSTRTVPVDEQGWARFGPLKGSDLVVTVKAQASVPSREPVLGVTTTMPVGATELIVPELSDLRRGPADDAPVSLPCGQGPELVVGRSTLQTRLTGTAGQLLRREPMTAQVCTDQVRLPAGLTRIRLEDGDLAAPQSLLLRRTDLAVAARRPIVRPTRIDSPSSERRSITVAAADEPQVLVVHENANPGWSATLQGRTLPSIRVDGWQQAWLVPAAGGQVDLLFAPGRTYRIGLVLGLVILAGLVVVAIGREPGRNRPGARRAPAVLVEAAPAGPRFTLLGMVAVLLVGGVWAVGPLVGAFVMARLRPAWLTATGVVACFVAAVAGALTAGADDVGVLAGIGSVCGLVLAALQLSRLDLDADRKSLLQALAFSARWAGTRLDGDPVPAARSSDDPAPAIPGSRSAGAEPDDDAVPGIGPEPWSDGTDRLRVR